MQHNSNSTLSLYSICTCMNQAPINKGNKIVYYWIQSTISYLKNRIINFQVQDYGGLFVNSWKYTPGFDLLKLWEYQMLGYSRI